MFASELACVCTRTGGLNSLTGDDGLVYDEVGVGAAAAASGARVPHPVFRKRQLELERRVKKS